MRRYWQCFAAMLLAVSLGDAGARDWHVIARKHDGSDDLENLCLACHLVQSAQGPNIATLVDGVIVPLFHPRTDLWADHFMRRGDLIVGRTPVEMGTVELLNMNDDDRRRIRVPTIGLPIL